MTYQGNPQMNHAVVEKPMRESALGTHHVGVFLRRHALLVLFGYRCAIDSVLEIAVWFACGVRGWTVFVGLRYYGSGFGLCGDLLLLGGSAAEEFGREAFGGCGGGMAEGCCMLLEK
jgi:hypothetical protein